MMRSVFPQGAWHLEIEVLLTSFNVYIISFTSRWFSELHGQNSLERTQANRIRLSDLVQILDMLLYFKTRLRISDGGQKKSTLSQHPFFI